MFTRCQGGGGYGDPLDREAAEVLRDVIEGYVSLDKAKDLYKVVISPESLELDPEATQKLRQEAKAKAGKYERSDTD